MNGIDLSSLPDPSTALLDRTSDSIQDLRQSGASNGEAAERFQALLTTLLVKEMRRALPEGFFGGGPGAETFESWMDEHLGRALAEQDALGLAGQLKTSVQRLQDLADGSAGDPTGGRAAGEVNR